MTDAREGEGDAALEVGEAQEWAVGQHRATQASPRHTTPPPPLRDGRGLSKQIYL